MTQAGVLSALWLATLLAAAWVGWDYGRADMEAEQAAAVRRALEQQTALDAENREVEQAAQEQAQRVRIVYRDRIKRVTEYVATNPDRVVCLDADGVQLFNDLGAGVENATGDAVRETTAPADRRDGP